MTEVKQTGKMLATGDSGQTSVGVLYTILPPFPAVWQIFKVEEKYVQRKVSKEDLFLLQQNKKASSLKK